MIVGLGSIGNRHLEGILKLKHKVNIFLFDTRVKNIKLKKRTHQVLDLNSLSKKIHKFKLVIVSTTSTQRYFVSKKIINLFQVENLILEKFVFTSEYQFKSFNQILKKYKVKTFINCPRRNYSMYIYMKDILLKNLRKIISLDINHKDFMILSNCIHFVDLFLFLSNSKFKIENIDLKPKKIIKTKRKQYFDIRGNIKFKFKNTLSTVFVSDSKNIKNHFSISIGSKNFIVNEQYNYISYGNKIKRFKDSHLQSYLTHTYIKNLISNKSINLPTYQSLLNINLKLISTIKKNEYLKGLKFT